MRYVLIFLGILVLADISWFSYINGGSEIIVNYKPFIGNFKVNSGWMFFAGSIYAYLGGVMIAIAQALYYKKELKKFQRKNEKSSIESEENSDKVKALEAKIQTLEIALKETLNRK